MKPITLAELRKVSKPTVRGGQSRYLGKINAKGEQGLVIAMTGPLSRVVAYSVLPRLERGREVEVRWQKLRGGSALGAWTDWVKVKADV